MLALAASLAACGGSSDGDAARSARLDDTQCVYRLHASLAGSAQVRCGVLVVPQDRRRPKGPEIRIPYLVLRAAVPTQAPPVVYLTGGPGQTWLDTVPNVMAGGSLGFDGGAQPAFDQIVIEQRGSAATQPALRCATATWAPENFGADGFATALASALRGVRDCAAGWLARGVATEGINTVEMADDVADLLHLLGQPRAVLNGVSFGTAWAIEVMRRHPARVSSAVLDSLVQPSAQPTATLATGVEQALLALSDACSADPACTPLGAPTLIERIDALVPALDASVVPWAEGPGGRLTSGAFLSVVGGTLAFQPLSVPQVVELAEALLGAGQGVDSLPETVRAQLLTAAGDGAQTQLDGQFLSVTCADGTNVDPATTQANEARLRPSLRAYAQRASTLYEQACRAWPARRDLPAERYRPLQSEIPVLVLSGLFDPLTPRAWAEDAVRTLPRARLVSFPNRSHSLQGTACTDRIVADFIAGRTPDAACAASDGGR